MTDMNNINNIGRHHNYPPQIKKEDSHKPEHIYEDVQSQPEATGLEHAEMLGRAFVEMKKPAFISKVNEDIEIYKKNPELINIAMEKSFDKDYELLLEDGTPYPYEQACEEICSEIENRLK